MSVTKRNVACVLMILGLFTLQACASQGVNSVVGMDKADRKNSDSLREVRLSKKTDNPLALIAKDLVNALAQIPELNPGKQTLRIPPAKTQFDLAVSNALKLKGYRVIAVSTQTGTNVVLSSVVPNLKNTSRPTYTHIIAINRVALKRTYSSINNTVAPTSSLYVRGARPGLIQLDDRLFISSDTTK